MNYRAVIALTLAAATVLTGCAPAAETQPTPDPFSKAWLLCVDAHPPLDMYAPKEPTSSGKQIQQTAEEACLRWMDTVGTDTFTEQWTEDYAESFKEAFG